MVLFIEVVSVFVVLYFGVTQVLWPIWRETPLFPMFRRERALYREIEETRQREIERELERERARLALYGSNKEGGDGVPRQRERES